MATDNNAGDGKPKTVPYDWPRWMNLVTEDLKNANSLPYRKAVLAMALGDLCANEANSEKELVDLIEGVAAVIRDWSQKTFDLIPRPAEEIH